MSIVVVHPLPLLLLLPSLFYGQIDRRWKWAKECSWACRAWIWVVLAGPRSFSSTHLQFSQPLGIWARFLVADKRWKIHVRRPLLGLSGTDSAGSTVIQKGVDPSSRKPKSGLHPRFYRSLIRSSLSPAPSSSQVAVASCNRWKSSGRRVSLGLPRNARGLTRRVWMPYP